MLLHFLSGHAKSKVNNLQGERPRGFQTLRRRLGAFPVVYYQNVVQLQVPVGNVLTVHIGQASEELSDNFLYFFFGQEPSVVVLHFDVVVETGAFDVFHEKVE